MTTKVIELTEGRLYPMRDAPVLAVLLGEAAERAGYLVVTIDHNIKELEKVIDATREEMADLQAKRAECMAYLDEVATLMES